MSTIIRARKSTKRLAFKWSVTVDGVESPLDLTGMSLRIIIDTEKVESTPDAPVHVDTIDGVITDAAAGKAYFPLTEDITGTIQTLYYDVWAIDANGEDDRIDSGKLPVVGSLK